MDFDKSVVMLASKFWGPTPCSYLGYHAVRLKHNSGVGDMLVRLLSFALCASSGFWLSAAQADYCTVKPTAVIVHTNQIVYFTAETVCPDWCQLPPGWSDATKDRAFSLLTTALVQARPVTLFFASGCGRQPVYSEPEVVMLTRDR